MAWSFGTRLRNIFIDGAKQNGGHQSYVNYAYGGETVEEMYGANNIGRLRRLKTLYDPLNRFRYYAPLVVDDTTDTPHNEAPIREEL